FVFEPLPPAVPPALVTLLTQMVHLDPNHRPASIEAVHRILQQVEQDLLDGRPVTGPSTGNQAIRASLAMRSLPSQALSPSSTGTLLQLYQGHRDQVRAVGWAPDGRLLASS